MLRRSDFLSCYNQGQRFFSRNFIIFVWVQPGHKTWRSGIAVSKKIGGAVVRNRMKRILREVLRQSQSLLVAGTDLVIVPKKHLQGAQVSFKPVHSELVPVFHQIKNHANSLMAQSGCRV